MRRTRSMVLGLGLLLLGAAPGSAWGGTGGAGTGGAPATCTNDGICDPPTENCTCADCAPLALCHPGQCVDDGVCDLHDSCICKDCAMDAYCSDPSHCKDGGACDTVNEGCECANCAAEPECAAGGTSSSTSGGAGGGGAVSAGSQGCAYAPRSPASAALLALSVAAAFVSVRRRRRG